MRFTVVLLCLMVSIVACQKESLPYKFVSDTKPVGSTDAVVGVPKAASTAQAPLTVASKQQATITWDCKDSDYGDNTAAKGIVSGRNSDGITFLFYDECFGSILIENNCVDGKPESRKVRCDRGCQNGFCI